MVKVNNGPRPDGPCLCGSCRHGTVMRGAAESAEQVYCGYIGKPVRVRVVECSSFQGKAVPTLHEMSEMAWVLTVRKHSREVGFIRSSKFREEYREEVLPPQYDPF